MTIEQKAQRYDEAIKVAENIYRFSSDPAEIKRIEQIFPELAESGDERIRKELIEIVEEIRSTTYYGRCCYKEIPFKSILAWLEKQGEHANFLSKIQVGDKVTRNEDGVLVNLSQLNRVAKPAEEYNITGIKSRNAQGKLGEMIKNLKPVNEVLEHEPAWSEEDEDVINLILCICDDFKNSFGEHVGAAVKNDIKKIEKWLKSLKPQKLWKPTEEQMKALHGLNLTGGVSHTGQGQVLIELYNDLKKLKEE